MLIPHFSPASGGERAFLWCLPGPAEFAGFWGRLAGTPVGGATGGPDPHAPIPQARPGGRAAPPRPAGRAPPAPRAPPPPARGPRPEGLGPDCPSTAHPAGTGPVQAWPAGYEPFSGGMVVPAMIETAHRQPGGVQAEATVVPRTESATADTAAMAMTRSDALAH